MNNQKLLMLFLIILSSNSYAADKATIDIIIKASQDYQIERLNKIYPFWKDLDIRIVNRVNEENSLGNFNTANNRIQLKKGTWYVAVLAHEITHWFQWNVLKIGSFGRESYDPKETDIIYAIEKNIRWDYGWEADLVSYVISLPPDIFYAYHAIAYEYLDKYYPFNLKKTFMKELAKK